jgi:hypothetical protein
MKNRVVVLMAGLLACLMILGGCGPKYEPKNFSIGEMSIELTTGFKKEYSDKYDAMYISQKIGVYVTKDAFEDYEEDVDIENMSLYGYAEGLINGNELDAKVQMDKGLTTFTHEVRVDKTYYTYYVVVYKAETAFWRVEFATRSDSFEDQLDAIRDYAWSVEFE